MQDIMQNLNQNSKKIRILAIETSCDETSVAVVEGTDFPMIKSNVVASQIDIHKLTAGVVPEVAAREHCKVIIPVIERALACLCSDNQRRGGQLHDKLKDIDAIAVTVGPGLVGSLLIGVETAKALAFASGKPLIPINHLEGHIFAALAANNFEFRISNFDSNSNIPNNQTLKIQSKFRIQNSDLLPALALVVSGGHTELVLIKEMFDYEIIGETLDDAAGEAFDKVGTLLGLEYPCGPEISKLAEEYERKIKNKIEKSKNTNKKSNIKLPRPMLNSGDLNFSFSGLKTAVVNLVKCDGISSGVAESTLPRWRRSEIAYEFQEAVVEVLLEKTFQTFILKSKIYNLKSVLLTGGVSANKRLRQVFQERFGDKLLISPLELTGDNAGMIGLAAWHRLQLKVVSAFPWKAVDANPNLQL